jgi:hypothetical protein
MAKSEDILSKELLDKVELNAGEIEKVVTDIIEPYVSELDDYMKWVREILRDDEKPPTDVELDDIAMTLSTLIYFVSTGTEQMGIRDDLSKVAYKEAYNTARSMLDKGTVADKNTQAELDALSDHIVNVVYSKAYKIMKAKAESAQEVLASVKKVISRRCSEMELSRIQTNN